MYGKSEGKGQRLWSSHLLNWYDASIRIILGVGLLLLLGSSMALLSYRYAADGGEVPLLDQLRRLARGDSIYPPSIGVEHWNVSNYPPVYHLLLVPAMWFFGPAFWYGRLLSILATIGSTYLVARIVLNIGGQKREALTAAVLFLMLPFVFGWGLQYRVDMLALCCSLAGLAVLAPRELTPERVLVAALLFVAAVYAKQSYGLAAPAAAVVWTWVRDRRMSYILLGVYAALGSTLCVALTLVTGGGFPEHIVVANANPIQLSSVATYLRYLGHNQWALILAATLGLSFLPGAKKVARKDVCPFVFAYFGLSVMLIPAIGKIGANLNYFLEWGAAASLAVGAGMVLGRGQRRPITLTLVHVLVLAQSMWSLATAAAFTHHVHRASAAGPDIAILEARIAASSGPILTDVHLDLLPLNGRDIYYQPLEMRLFYLSSQVRPEHIVPKVRTRVFSLVITACSPEGMSWPTEITDAITENYRVDQVLRNGCIYVPSP